MNATASLIRHILTYLAGLGGFLFAHGIIPAESVDAANQAGSALVDPLAVLGGLLAAAALRLAIFLLGKIFPAWAAKLGSESGGMTLLMVGLATAALMGALPSCSATPGEYPVTGTVSFKDAASGAQVGLSIGSPPAKARRVKHPRVDADSNK